MSLERRVLQSPSSNVNLSGREVGCAVLHLSDGTQVQGMLFMPSGGGLLELLNLPGGQFISLTSAQVTSDGTTRVFSSVVVNKDQIVAASLVVDETDGMEARQ